MNRRGQAGGNGAGICSPMKKILLSHLQMPAVIRDLG